MKDIVLRTVLILLGIACCLYCGCVIMIIGTGNWFNFAFGIIGVVLIADGILIRKLKKLNKLCPRIVSILILVAILLCLVNFVIFEAQAIRYGSSIPKDDATWLIVLGAKVTDGRPSVEFAARLDKALEYSKNNPDTKIIVTGGQGSDEAKAESEAAKIWLLDNGISVDRIYSENKSTTTEENFKYAIEVMKANGGKLDDSVVIVSSEFHLYRASKLAISSGLTNTSYTGGVGLKILIPQYYLREYAATVAGNL